MDFVSSLSASALYYAYKAWCSTLRYSFEGEETPQRIWRSGSPFVLALWHEELFPAIFVPRRLTEYRLLTIASQSRDGDIVTIVLERLGYVIARGSSNRGGVKALLTAARAMRENQVSAAVTIDGPKGPRHKAKDGIFFLAHKASAPVIPMRCTVSRAKTFRKSWDHFQLPLPFSRVRVRFGAPLWTPSEKLDEAALERMRSKLETALKNLAPERAQPL